MNPAPRARVVVIEDDEDIRMLEAEILRGDGWDVEAAGTGRQGVDLVRSTIPDVVVCDLMLPDIDGLAVIRALQDHPTTADIPVLLVSAMGEDHHIAAGIESGALDYIAKPFQPVQLQFRARAALRVRRNYVSLLRVQEDLRATTESLLATQAIQRASLDALEQGVALVGSDATVRLLNTAGERILGFTIDDLTARFQSGSWDTFYEDGRLMPLEERPIAHTLATGGGVKDRVVAWYAADGSFVILRVACEPLHNADGELDGLVVAFADITAQRAAERAEQAANERLAWEATHDSLTGLANRAMLLEHLRSRLADPTVGRTALLYVDIDHFKLVNDTQGHDVGDELLVVVARRLEQAVRPNDLVARYGGDEFLVVVPADTDEEAERIAARILERVAAPVSLSSGPLVTSVSIGLAHDTAAGVDALVRDADTALLRAKRDGRGRVATMTLEPGATR